MFCVQRWGAALALLCSTELKGERRVHSERELRRVSSQVVDGGQGGKWQDCGFRAQDHAGTGSGGSESELLGATSGPLSESEVRCSDIG